jgi:protein-L-isoaspartate(D-aspartate) O-methyltransferase
MMSNFKAERENMIESQVRPNAVTHVELLKAMLKIPRELFVPPSQRSLSYMDGALRVEAARDGHPARYLLSPMVFAKLVQLADIKPEDKVLDVGAATGYSTAILALLARHVVALECDAGLVGLAKDGLAGQKIENAQVIAGPLQDGVQAESPFDVIFLNGRLGREPEMLFPQLSEGGRLVAVMGEDTASKAQIFRKIDSKIQRVMAFDAAAPLLPGFEPEQAFAF